MIVFLRFRHKWASRIYEWDHLSRWVTPECDLDALMDEVGEELCDEFSYSDKYRGVDVERVENPPGEWIQERIGQCHGVIKSNQEMLAELRKLMLGVES